MILQLWPAYVFDIAPSRPSSASGQNCAAHGEDVSSLEFASAIEAFQSHKHGDKIEH